MTTFELLGMFWTILATTCFTAAVLMAASVSLWLGFKTLYCRYERGTAQEVADLHAQDEFRKMKAGQWKEDREGLADK